ncbi:MAG TPA: CAP domain-containing protein [Candidatus Saccharimonadales bacterium]|nr:CAP domain-containing protein [Candidatus Saccharimonadales bacterium]
MALTPAPKRLPHHKKQHGQHHRHGKHYLKAYHPYLPLLLLVVIGLAVNVFWSQRTSVLSASTSLTATQLLQATNQQRTRGNQDGLAMNAKLSAAAQTKANDMAARGYWSHDTPGGERPWAFITRSGYEYYSAGENLAYGFTNAESAVAGWMSSSSHRATLLHADYRDVGFGIATAKNYRGQANTTLIVALYAEPSLSIEGTGFASTTATAAAAPLRTVSRIQLLTGGHAPWSYALAVLVSGMAAGWFLARHVRAWRRVLVESEEFIVRHKFLDVLIVGAAVAGFVLTQAAGFIH